MIGFASSPKPCGFQFRLTLAWSGQVAAAADIRWFEVYDSSKNWVDVTSSYDEATGYFSVMFNDPENGKDPDGYWVFFTPARDSNYLYTQYPTRYRWDDMYRAADRISPGRYEDVLHYFRQVVTDNREIISGAVVLDTPFVRTLTVESTVPYRVDGSYYHRSFPLFKNFVYTLPHGWGSLDDNPAYKPIAWPPVEAVGGVLDTIEGEHEHNFSAIYPYHARVRITGIGSEVEILDTAEVDQDSFVVGYGSGNATYEAMVEDASDDPPTTITLWKMADYKEYFSSTGVTQIKTCVSFVAVGLSASYDY